MWRLCHATSVSRLWSCGSGRLAACAACEGFGFDEDCPDLRMILADRSLDPIDRLLHFARGEVRTELDVHIQKHGVRTEVCSELSANALDRRVGFGGAPDARHVLRTHSLAD